MMYTRPHIIKLNRGSTQHFSLYERELELDRIVLDKMGALLTNLDAHSMVMLKDLLERGLELKEILLKRIK